MKRILITSPNSIAGSLILNGFKSGFKANSCYILEKDAKNLSIEDIEKFKPDIIFGYDYGFLLPAKMDLIDYIINNKEKFKLVHYFADEPDSKWAYVEKYELYKEYLQLVEDKQNVFSFVWDKTFCEQIPNSIYLPLAVNYKAYRPEEDKKYEISFVGRPLTDKRQKILATLIKYFGKKLNIFCFEKHFLQSIDDMKEKQFLTEEELDTYKSAYKGFLTTEQDIANVYFNSKVNINITLQGKSGMNYRVFEVLASRGFLITDETEDTLNSFEVAKELETYKDINDLIDKTEFYLKHYEIAQKIALNGFANVAKSHNYTARARKILDTIKNS